MILSNNPKTCIDVTMQHSEYGGILSKIYTYRWTGPSATRIFNLQFTLWYKKNNKI